MAVLYFKNSRILEIGLGAYMVVAVETSEGILRRFLNYQYLKWYIWNFGP